MSCSIHLIHLANIGVCPITELVIIIDLHNVPPPVGAGLKDHMLPEIIQNAESTLDQWACGIMLILVELSVCGFNLILTD